VSHLCKITVWAYWIRDRSELPKGKEHGWDDVDLENAIDYCTGLLEEGFTEEPMDHFDLADFIAWAKSEMNPSDTPAPSSTSPE
jgi:hypothetical protein